VTQLQYVINGIDNPTAPCGSADILTLKASASMHEEFLEIQAKYPNLAPTDMTIDQLTSLSSCVFPPSSIREILDLLQGNSINEIAQLPSGWSSSLTPDKILPQRLTYKDGVPGAADASLKLRGLLTAAEIAALQKILTETNAPLGIADAFQKLRQASVDNASRIVKMIRDILSPIIENQIRLKGPSVEEVLLRGDSEAGALVSKMSCFLDYLITSLRRSAQEQVIASALGSSSSGLDSQMTLYLLQNIIKVDAPGQINGPSVMDDLISIFGGIEEPTLIESNWEGYISPSQSDDYVFLAPTQPRFMNVDGNLYTMSKIDADNIWATGRISLSAEKSTRCHGRVRTSYGKAHTRQRLVSSRLWLYMPRCSTKPKISLGNYRNCPWLLMPFL